MIAADRMELGATAKRDDETPIWENLNYGKDVPFTKLKRYTLSRAGDSNWKCKIDELSQRSVDFPVLNPSVSCKKVIYNS